MCVRACVRARARESVSVCVRACVCVCVGVWGVRLGEFQCVIACFGVYVCPYARMLVSIVPRTLVFAIRNN